MSPLNINDLHRIFDKLDQDSNGFVTLDELEWLLERFGVKTSQEELKSLVGKTELDLIDFSLFYESVIKPDWEEQNEEEGNDIENVLAKAFNVYDLDGDGYITCDELQSVLEQLGFWDEHCGKDCRSMINLYDKNSDGVLDFEEFKNMMLPTSP